VFASAQSHGMNIQPCNFVENALAWPRAFFLQFLGVGIQYLINELAQDVLELAMMLTIINSQPKRITCRTPKSTYLFVIWAVVTLYQPCRLRIRYFTEGPNLPRPYLLLRSLDNANLKTCILGSLQNLISVQAKEYFSGILTS